MGTWGWGSGEAWRVLQIDLIMISRIIAMASTSRITITIAMIIPIDISAGTSFFVLNIQ